MLTFGLGHYPNQDVQEAFVCLAHRGRQHNLRLSRQLGDRAHVTQVGPFHAHVVEPYRVLRFELADNETGITFALDWQGSFDPHLEDRHIETSGRRITHDLTRYVQVGRGQGYITVGDERLIVEPDTWWGERDHSWGLRPLPRAPGAPPTGRPEWSFLLFMPLQFPDFGVHRVPLRGR